MTRYGGRLLTSILVPPSSSQHRNWAEFLTQLCLGLPANMMKERQASCLSLTASTNPRSDLSTRVAGKLKHQHQATGSSYLSSKQCGRALKVSSSPQRSKAARQTRSISGVCQLYKYSRAHWNTAMADTPVHRTLGRGGTKMPCTTVESRFISLSLF